MSFIWEKSSTWRWIVASSKASRGFFFTFTGICVVGSWALGEAVMRTTNLSQTKLDEELRQSGRKDSMMMGKVNKERLGQFLQEIQRKENTEDRYAAALRGETLTGTPEARIRGGGTSMPASSGLPEKVPTPVKRGPGVEESTLPATSTSGYTVILALAISRKYLGFVLVLATLVLRQAPLSLSPFSELYQFIVNGES